MFENLIKPGNLTDRIENIYKKLEGCSMDPAIIDSVEEDIHQISIFLNCTHEEAFLMSLLLYNAISGGSISIKSVMEHLECSFSHAIRFNEILKPMVARDFISPKRDIQLFPTTDYMMNHKLVKSLFSEKMQMEDEHETIDQFVLLTKFQRLFAKRKDRQYDYNQLLQAGEQLLDNHRNLEWVKFMENESLNTQNKLLYVLHCMAFYQDSMHYDIDNIVKELNPDKQESYRLKNAYRVGSLPLIQQGLIKESKMDMFLGDVQYQLTAKGLAGFDQQATLPNDCRNGLLTATEPHKIHATCLVFDPREEKQIQKLKELLSEDNFPALTTRLKEQGMKPGVNILFHGLPGTGKTESVFQLAKLTNRRILLADASKIRSKWIGDTEKNIRALFEEYKNIHTNSTDTPILLFNEADGIFGKRMTINDRGDQMENTLQNILLEELENFEGIFIATTNMSLNFDKAFDRRFLYKIKFEKPGMRALQKIWKDKFPSLSNHFIKKLSLQHKLSGAQIENIRKKVAVDQVLNPSTRITFNYLEELIRQELSFDQKKTNNTPIGFYQSSKPRHHEYR